MKTGFARIRRVTAVAANLTALVACGGGVDSGARARTQGVAAFADTAWMAPTETDIPADSMGASIRRGLYLLRFTPESLPRFATSSLRCTSCHQNDGTKATSAPLTGSHARFPRYLARSAAVVSLADRVNYCMTRSLAGNALPHESREMTDILAYLAFISRDIPVGHKSKAADGLLAMKDTLVGDTARGRELFAKTCAVCHGPDGGGVAPFPALWGPRSYSIGASMARQERAASFILHNMPQSSPGSLSAQQAFDVAAFVNGHPRPDSPGKEDDWPNGGAPRDVPYTTRGHQAFNPPSQLIRRQNSRGALVPPPPSVRRTN
ncbi:MAG TPA: c-type cytochrome [Gemmatimonadaceae bacterium]|nr:c-type cytochrome [Gemmatimonadaceae bacterium]